ncbi:MAG: putative entry exclusion protein TrbK-alt [Pseudomonadota bacterium]|jgi:conjugative transfer region protein TrbK
MDGKTLARLAAVIFIAAAVAATALEMTRRKDEPGEATSQRPTALAPSALREGLRRCQSLGEAALLDSDCSRLWAQQRDRFLGIGSPSPNADVERAAPRSPNAIRQGTR